MPELDNADTPPSQSIPSPVDIVDVAPNVSTNPARRVAPDAIAHALLDAKTAILVEGHETILPDVAPIDAPKATIRWRFLADGHPLEVDGPEVAQTSIPVRYREGRRLGLDVDAYADATHSLIAHDLPLGTFSAAYVMHVHLNYAPNSQDVNMHLKSLLNWRIKGHDVSFTPFIQRRYLDQMPYSQIQGATFASAHPGRHGRYTTGATLSHKRHDIRTHLDATSTLAYATATYRKGGITYTLGATHQIERAQAAASSYQRTGVNASWGLGVRQMQWQLKTGYATRQHKGPSSNGGIRRDLESFVQGSIYHPKAQWLGMNTRLNVTHKRTLSTHHRYSKQTLDARLELSKRF